MDLQLKSRLPHFGKLSNDTEPATIVATAQNVNALVEQYGFVFISSIADSSQALLIPNLTVQNNSISSSQSESVQLQIKKKIVVFVDDPPIVEGRICWMGRMLTVGLISCGYSPLLIPWNDLSSGLLSKYSWRLPLQKPTDESDNIWKLRKVFSLALENPAISIIILDIDWSVVNAQEFIAEAETLGCELMFMKSHVEINRIKFVSTALVKIRKKISPTSDPVSFIDNKLDTAELTENNQIYQITKPAVPGLLRRIYSFIASKIFKIQDVPVKNMPPFATGKTFMSDTALYEETEGSERYWDPLNPNHIIWKENIEDEQFIKFIEHEFYTKPKEVETDEEDFFHSQSDLDDLESIFSDFPKNIE